VLIEECISGKRSTYKGCNNEHLICRLVTTQNDPGFIVCQSRRARYPQPEGASLVGAPILKQIVKSSFLPKLTAKDRDFSKLGHSFCNKTIAAVKREAYQIFCGEIHHVGLVKKR